MRSSFVTAATALLLSVSPAAAWLADPSKVGPLTLASKKTTKCDVTDYGGSTSSDIGAAITKAFTDCVAKNTGATLYVPEGTYTISTPVKLNDQDNWAFQLDGELVMDQDGSYDGNLIIVERVSDFEMFSSNGKGAIQGNGYLERTGQSSQNTRLLRFLDSSDYAVHDLLLIDSPSFHMVHNDATNLEVYGITIRGGNKGGLDGIDLICTSNCYIHDSEVTNRDECVSVKTPSKNVLIENMYCNQSGGMSIGSLDANDGAEVEMITMRNIYIFECTQMLMIKTFPGGSGANGYVRNSVFENFWAYDTTYALDIDQYWESHTSGDTGAIAISDLVFRNWTGTVANGVERGPIVIRGSDIVPLTNITLEDFGMWTVSGDEVVLQCKNVYGSGYCAQSLASGATATTFTTSQTITSTMSGFVSPTSPAWGLPATGYGTDASIPVYTPAAMFTAAMATAQGGSVAATSAAVAVQDVTTSAAAASSPEATSVQATSTAAAAVVTTNAAATTAAAVTSASTAVAAPSAPAVSSIAVSEPAASLTSIASSSVASASPATTASAGAGSVGKYYQCGGKAWTGATACVEGATCQVQNDYYSQCL